MPKTVREPSRLLVVVYPQEVSRYGDAKTTNTHTQSRNENQDNGLIDTLSFAGWAGAKKFASHSGFCTEPKARHVNNPLDG